LKPGIELHECDPHHQHTRDGHEAAVLAMGGSILNWWQTQIRGMRRQNEASNDVNQADHDHGSQNRRE
jgi:hypothetical protein